MNTFCINDYGYQLHIPGGTAGRKHASISLESVLGGVVNNNQPIELLLDFALPTISTYWESTMELYLHEFTHTVEMELVATGYEVYGFHEALHYYSHNYKILESDLEVIKPYLLNQLIVGGKNIGIPYDFW